MTAQLKGTWPCLHDLQGSRAAASVLYRKSWLRMATFCDAASAASTVNAKAKRSSGKPKVPSPAKPKRAVKSHPIHGFDWCQIRKGTRLILVASAALISSTGKLLLSQRVGEKYLAGCWEFPGGKVVKGETPMTALVRELEEELHIQVAVEDLSPLSFTTCKINSTTAALILLFGVHKWSSEPHGAENQPLMWISPEDILNHQVTDACQNMHLAVCQAVAAHCTLESAINT